ncbi:MAG: hypothetical protein QOK10_3131 [Pseudonocardiales bacterium]|nr:hypothetical protein [Pseudonocardiales bacterium]
MVTAEVLVLVATVAVSACLSRSRPDRRIKASAWASQLDPAGRKAFEGRLKLLRRAYWAGLAVGLAAPAALALAGNSELSINAVSALYGLVVAATAAVTVMVRIRPLSAVDAARDTQVDSTEVLGATTVRSWLLVGSGAFIGSIALYLLTLGRRHDFRPPRGHAPEGSCQLSSPELSAGVWVMVLIGSAMFAVALRSYHQDRAAARDASQASGTLARNDPLAAIGRQLCTGGVATGLWLQAALFLVGADRLWQASCPTDRPAVSLIIAGAAFNCLLIAVVLGFRYVVRWQSIAVRHRPEPIRADLS